MASISLRVDRQGLCAAVAAGDIQAVELLLRDERTNLNQRSAEGFAPLCIASFWGYADIVKMLLEHGADVNVTNKGSGWTPCHCAAFQGHGKALLYLMQYNPDLSLRDSAGRLASDFGSAVDTVWPFFAAKGCKRTSKAELIRMEIVKKADPTKKASSQKRALAAAYASTRPGSAYVINSQPLDPDKQLSQSSMAALAYGDVLREDPAATDEDHRRHSLQPTIVEEERMSFSLWNT